MVSHKLLLSCSQATRDKLGQNADKVLTFADLGRENVCFLFSLFIALYPCHESSYERGGKGKLLVLRSELQYDTSASTQSSLIRCSQVVKHFIHARTANHHFNLQTADRPITILVCTTMNTPPQLRKGQFVSCLFARPATRSQSQCRPTILSNRAPLIGGGRRILTQLPYTMGGGWRPA